jgi:SAM-dependent methyltransferase
MQPKPTHFSSDYGAWFKDPLVVAAYPMRPPYPPAVIELLLGLIVDEPRVVLDAGCGPGDLARRLAPAVERVDAVDASRGMLELGKSLPGGDAANLRWIDARVEEAGLSGQYALVTAGESLHWFDWEIALPMFAELLTSGGMLAVVERNFEGPPALRDRFVDIARQYSPVRDFRTTDLIVELEQRGLFSRFGERTIGPEPWRPTIEEYLECRHSQRGFSRTHMGPERVAQFDGAVRALLNQAVAAGEIATDGEQLELSARARVTWGKPRRSD